MLGFIRRRREARREAKERAAKRDMIIRAAFDSGFLEGWKGGRDVTLLRLHKILSGEHDLELERLSGRIAVLEHETRKLKREMEA